MEVPSIFQIDYNTSLREAAVVDNLTKATGMLDGVSQQLPPVYLDQVQNNFLVDRIVMNTTQMFNNQLIGSEDDNKLQKKGTAISGENRMSPIVQQIDIVLPFWLAILLSPGTYIFLYQQAVYYLTLAFWFMVNDFPSIFVQFTIDTYNLTIRLSILTYEWTIIAFWWSVDFTQKAWVQFTIYWAIVMAWLYARWLDFLEFMSIFDYKIAGFAIPWYYLYSGIFIAQATLILSIIFALTTTWQTVTLLFAPWYLEALWTLFLSPVLVLTIPMTMEQLYQYDFTNFKPASLTEIFQYALDDHWVDFALFLTMNENRFITPIIYEIAVNMRNNDLFWDLNRRDYLFYSLGLNLAKILIYWLLSPMIIFMLPFSGYFVLNVYITLFWLLMISHVVPDFELDTVYLLDLYRFYDWSNLLVLRADDLCPDTMVATPDGHCGCQDHQKLEGRDCVDLCPQYQSLNKYDTAIFDILPICLNVYEFYDWFATENPLIQDKTKLGGKITEPLSCNSKFKDIKTTFSEREMEVRDMQFIELITRWDQHYDSIVKVWMFLSTKDYNNVKQIIDIMDGYSVQCDSNPRACLGTKDSFINDIRSFNGAMMAYDTTGNVIWSQEGQMVLGHWHGLTRYSIEEGYTYLGFYNEDGLNGKMIQQVNTYCLGRINRNGIFESDYYGNDMTVSY